MLWPLVLHLAVGIVVMTAAWELQRRTRNAGYVDVAWAALMAVAALLYGAVAAGPGLQRLLVAMLAGIWAMRLVLHLLARVLSEAEDGRYRQLRTHWAGSQRRFFWFFQAQALIATLMSVPFLVAASNQVPASDTWTHAAVAVWILALVGESLADRQLARFRAAPENRAKVCRIGLWRYSRHPNYFFEWLHWFCYVLLSVGSPWWWVSLLLGPVLMGAALLWGTGIPYTEAQALRTRGEAYRRYQRETSAFFPWFPARRHNQ
ncbi:MAG TPA: DUF1295 domain-containing protein [Xanthomonadaceae bacterium]|nr:DUF1295 domain-containing protein [Xanthomonadaceae bacterium]